MLFLALIRKGSRKNDRLEGLGEVIATIGYGIPVIGGILAFLYCSIYGAIQACQTIEDGVVSDDLAIIAFAMIFFGLIALGGIIANGEHRLTAMLGIATIIVAAMVVISEAAATPELAGGLVLVTIAISIVAYVTLIIQKLK